MPSVLRQTAPMSEINGPKLGSATAMPQQRICQIQIDQELIFGKVSTAA